MVIEVVAIRGGSKPVLKKMRELRRKVKNPTPANREVSIWLMKWVTDNFKSQGGKVKGWAPFALGGRKIPGGGIDTSAKLLQDTGFLRASFHPFHSRTEAGVGAGAHRLDPNIPIYHELGLPLRNLPARRMLPLASDRDVNKAIVRIYNAYIMRAIR